MVKGFEEGGVKNMQLVSDHDSLPGHSRKADRMLAQSQCATSEQLVNLAQSLDRLTRKHVVCNPNTPPEVLMSLASSFPREFFHNPVFDFLIIVNPNLLNELPVSVFKSILKMPDCPQSMLTWAVEYGGGSLQLAVAERNDTPIDLLEKIANGRHVRATELASRKLLTSG